MTDRILFFAQGVPVFAYALVAVLQVVKGDTRLADISFCFAAANYLIFFGGK